MCVCARAQAISRACRANIALGFTQKAKAMVRPLSHSPPCRSFNSGTNVFRVCVCALSRWVGLQARKLPTTAGDADGADEIRKIAAKIADFEVGVPSPPASPPPHPAVCIAEKAERLSDELGGTAGS